MRDGLKRARASLRRGAADETLVLLWNALEPARLAGDRGALRAIGGMASVIARSGDEGQRSEAERLLAEVEGAAAASAATAALEGEFRPAGYEGEVQTGSYDMGGYEAGGYEAGGEPAEEPEQRQGIRLGGLVWLLILIGIIIINILGQMRE